MQCGNCGGNFLGPEYYFSSTISQSLQKWLWWYFPAAVQFVPEHSVLITEWERTHLYTQQGTVHVNMSKCPVELQSKCWAHWRTKPSTLYTSKYRSDNDFWYTHDNLLTDGRAVCASRSFRTVCEALSSLAVTHSASTVTFWGKKERIFERRRFKMYFPPLTTNEMIVNGIMPG